MVMTLTKEDGAADLAGVTHLKVGLAWDTSTGGSGGWVGKVKQRVGSDLDLIAVLMTGEKPVAYVGLDNLDPENGSIVHSGDEAKGTASGDDEAVTVDFARLPKHITRVVFVAAAFKLGSDMKRAKNIKVTLYDGTGGSMAVVAVIQPSLLSTKKVMALARVDRGANDAFTLNVVDGEYDIEQGKMDQLLKGAVNMR
jgi:stress response protein SCP2